VKHLSSAAKQKSTNWIGEEAKSSNYHHKGIAKERFLFCRFPFTVHRDWVFIRRQSKEKLQEHIDERLPEEYEKCIAGMNNVLKMTLNIANTVADPRTKLQALSLINDCYKYKMDLTTGGVIVTDAIKYVQTNIQKLMVAKKEEDSDKYEQPDNDEDSDKHTDESQSDEKPKEETGEVRKQVTTNQVF
jgi:hypothetical protein